MSLDFCEPPLSKQNMKTLHVVIAGDLKPNNRPSLPVKFADDTHLIIPTEVEETYTMRSATSVSGQCKTTSVSEQCKTTSH
jgi:hypothetical protein